MFTGNIKRTFFTASLACVAFFLPLSEWLLSVSIIILLLSWITNGGMRSIAIHFNQKKHILIFLSVYLIYIAWMINTSDLSRGLDQLRLKLPLLIFPVVTGFSEPLNRQEMKFIISSFISGVVISSVAGVISGPGFSSPGLADPKLLSPFISHIRLALMAVFAVACSGWYFLHNRQGHWHYWLFAASAIWLTVFLFLLLSITGIVLLILLLAVSAFILAYRSASRKVWIAVAVVVPVMILVCLTIIVLSFLRFYKPGDAYKYPLIDKTTRGLQYTHDPGRADIENGNRVWIYLCEEEIAREWEKQSLLSYEGQDRKGQKLKYTLIRYMTSAGLTKDSAGFAAMTSTDMEAVENGITNRNFLIWSPWRTKLYETIWQIDYYRRGGNPSGHSLTQRLEYFKTGIKIFLRYPVLGTGTGDLPLEYRKQYDLDNSRLDQSHRLLSHNQFLNFLVTFGAVGSVIIIFSVFYPFIESKGLKGYLPAMFFMLVVLSMLWEDTLETHTGVSFFAYFYSVFTFGTENYENQNYEKGP